jgi:hypothetical protein
MGIDKIKSGNLNLRFIKLLFLIKVINITEINIFNP